MQKLYTILILSLLLNIQGLSAHTLPDSIGVENNNGKKVIIHKVEAKETYYALGRKYNVNPKDIISFNENKALNPGTIVKVPTQRPYGGIQQPSVSPVQQQVTTGNATTHTVKAKENLGQIAEKYNTTVAAIRQANGITGSNLSIGQILKIPGTESTQQQTPEVVTKQPVTVASTNYTEHTVQKKEFLNKIAEQYGTTVDEIKRLNNLSNNNLSIGQILKVPSVGGARTITQNDPVTQPAVNNRNPVQNNGITHTVASGETIFSIAHKYNVTTYQIRVANSLGDDAVLSIGQKLNIPKAAEPKSVSDVAREDQQNNPDSTVTIKDPSMKRNPNVYGLNQAEEKGTAVWIANPDLDASKMMVLHRTLKIGSVIKITNPMTNISALVKVVGKFTENETTKDVIIVVTKAVADSLGVLDKRFFCNITYAVLENEQ